MRHSRRLSTHPNQPQGPFCTHCSVNLSTFPAYLRCADPACRNIPICVDCYSVGAAHTFPHKPTHHYRVIEKLVQPIYTPDWAAHEELRLLEALSEHGPHHWKAVADYVGKTQRKCELHYENVYLKGPNAPFASSSLHSTPATPSPAASADCIDQANPTDTKPPTEQAHPARIERQLNNSDSDQEPGTLDGFMPLRGDFDVEWDDKAEELVSDLSIDPDDTPEEKELKIRLLLMYDERLQRRNVVKEFLFDRKLLDFADLKYNDRRGTRDEKELSARLQVFSRLLSKPEFDAFYSSVMTEYRISRDVYRMAQARKVGLRKKAELDVYETERKARCQRLGEQPKAGGKEPGVQKRRRSSAAVDSPAPTATPLNSVPGTPGSLVLSPSNPTIQGDDATPDGPSEPNSVQVRRARERKRIARSPYPVLEAMPVDDMEDAWKLSLTEKKLCSALQIPPAEFLRMRDAMLYTASQDVKRRGRPRKRGSNTPVLTIRARRQGKGTAKIDERHSLGKAPEPSLILKTVPVSSSQQQRITLKQTSVPPTADAAPRLTLTCKPPTKNADGVTSTGLERSAGNRDEPDHEKLRLSMKVIPPEAQKPTDSAPVPTSPDPAPTAGALNSDDLPLSATFAAPSQEKDVRSPKAMEEAQRDTAKNVALEESVKEFTKEDSKENTRDGTPDSDVSCEEDLVHITASDRARPMTRSYARLSKRLREDVRTNLTRVSRSNSPLEGSQRADLSVGSHRTVLKVETLKVERPVTRLLAARIHSKTENSNSQPSTPTSEDNEEELEDLDGVTEAQEKAQTGHSKEYRVPRKRSHYDHSNPDVRNLQDGDADNQEGPIGEPENGESGLLKPAESPDDDSSSRDEVDEVLCGEDGAGNWPMVIVERKEAEPAEPAESAEPGTASRETSRKMSPGITPQNLANTRHHRPLRNGSEADELLDQGRASVDSTPGRIPQTLARKQPKCSVRTSQRLAGKQPIAVEGTPQRLARKRPRHLVPTDSPQKTKRITSPKRSLEPTEKDRESKETEVTIDRDGELEEKVEVQSNHHKSRRSDAADSVEILSSGDGDYSESLGKSPNEVEEVTLDEEQGDGAEDLRDATWSPQEFDLCDERQDLSDHNGLQDDDSVENTGCQTELGMEPGTPDTSFQEGEVQQFVKSKNTVDDRRRTRGRAHRKESLLAVRKSSRVQKRSRRLEESVLAAAQPVKRRRTSPKGNRTKEDSESPAPVPKCTVITSQVGSASLDNAGEIEAEFDNVSKRFTLETPRSKRKTSRQGTPSRSRYPTGERRVTRSAGRQTRSRSNSLRNRSLTDRLSLRRA